MLMHYIPEVKQVVEVRPELVSHKAAGYASCRALKSPGHDNVHDFFVSAALFGTVADICSMLTQHRARRQQH